MLDGAVFVLHGDDVDVDFDRHFAEAGNDGFELFDGGTVESLRLGVAAARFCNAVFDGSETFRLTPIPQD